MPTKKSSSQAGMERGSRAIVAPEQNVSSDLIKEISSLNQALRLEGEKVRAVLSSMADPLLMYDAEGILTDASDTATEIFGFDPRGMHQRDILEKIDLRMLDGRRMKFPEMASVRALHGEILRNFIFTFRDKDGKRRVALCSAAPIRAGEKITGVVAYWLDATEQKKMEADLAWESEVNASMADLARILLRPSALENISYLVLQHAKKLTNSVYGFAGYVDPATGDFICPTLAREIWKDCEVTDKKSIFRALSSKSSLIGRVWEDKKPLVANSVSCDARAGGLPKGHIPIERFLAVPAIFGDARVGMIGLANSEHAYSEKDLVVAERLAALYAIAIQRKRAEETLQESRERYRTLSENLEETVRKKVAELQQAQRLATIGQMVSIVAHEIRNPLQNISLGLENIRDGVSADPDLLDSLNDMEKGVDSLNRLVQQILEYSRPVSLQYSTRPFAYVIQQALDATSHELADYDLVLDLKDKEKEVSVDVDRIKRVLVNLISNSVEAMPLGGMLKISSCIKADDEHKYLYLSVSDTGVGISEPDLERIQEPFFTKKSQGTGLGLSICKKIVDAHGGSLKFYSKPGEGTTAEVMVPTTPLA